MTSGADAIGALRSTLTARGLATWAGTDRLSQLPLHLPQSAPLTDAAKLYGLLVAGDTVALETPEPDRGRARARDTYSIALALRERGLVDIVDGSARARVSILPLGRSLLVCDRLDADGGLDTVCWPDDSSYHLARAIPPGRRRRWLDIATGSAFAPLLRPELADAIVGADLNQRGIGYARHGVELSGLSHITLQQADLTAGIAGPFELVTCNAPIPAHVGPLWRATADVAFFARLAADAPCVLAPGGMIVIHGALAALAPVVADLRGERVVVSYVPEGGTQFGIVWWRPDAAPRHVVTCRELTAQQPHLTDRDRDDAIG